MQKQALWSLQLTLPQPNRHLVREYRASVLGLGWTRSEVSASGFGPQARSLVSNLSKILTILNILKLIETVNNSQILHYTPFGMTTTKILRPVLA